MSEVNDIKAQLWAAIEASKPDGTYDDETFDKIHGLIAKLVPHTPTPRPIDNQGFVQSPWGSGFAQFGPKHTAGKPIHHVSSMKLQSFARFPDIPIQVHDIDQEIRVEGKHYNNVSDVSVPGTDHHANLIVWGRYDIDPDEPQRYKVEFYAVELVAPEGVSDEDLRTQFGLEEGAELHRDLKPPKLHSDVVYCDDDTRINFGNMGGVYVMRRKGGAGKSVSFT